MFHSDLQTYGERALACFEAAVDEESEDLVRGLDAMSTDELHPMVLTAQYLATVARDEWIRRLAQDRDAR